MDNYNKLLQLASDDTVELAEGFKELLHTELVLGQSRWLCRYGTLSDGHEKYTDHQRYTQAIKEMYYLGGNIRQQKVNAKFAQADLLDAQEELEKATKASDKLRAEAKIEAAQDRILTSLVTVEDQMRMLDEYNRVRLELQAPVRAKYPGGIEQAELDNWTAVAEARAKKRSFGMPELMSNIPLPAEEKAKLGLRLNAPDLTIWQQVSDQQGFNQMLLAVVEEAKQLEAPLALVEKVSG